MATAQADKDFMKEQHSPDDVVSIDLPAPQGWTKKVFFSFPFPLLFSAFEFCVSASHVAYMPYFALYFSFLDSFSKFVPSLEVLFWWNFVRVRGCGVRFLAFNSQFRVRIVIFLVFELSLGCICCGVVWFGLCSPSSSTG